MVQDIHPVARAGGSASPAVLLRKLLLTREGGVLCAVFLLAVIFTAMSPVFMTGPNIINLLRQVSLLGILAIGATFVLIISEVDLSVGSLYGFSGLVAGTLLLAGVPEAGVIVLVLLLGAGIGALNGGITILGGIPSFITTLGTLYLIRGITLVISNGMAVSLPYGSETGSILKFLSQGQVFGLSIQVVLLAVVAIIGFVLLHRTTFGFHVFAVGGNERASRIIGVPTGLVKVTAFSIAGGLAALAGMVNFGFLENVQPVTGSGLELDVIAAVIIGGTRLGGGQGSVVGTLLGVLLIGIVRNGLVLLGVTPFWQTTLIGAVVLAAALIGGVTSKNRSK